MANKPYTVCALIPNGNGMSFMKGGKARVAAGGILWMAAFLIGISFASDDSAGELLVAIPAQFDAGTVLEGKVIEATAIIQNVGNAQVEITNVQTS
jgi:hypothetical protein